MITTIISAVALGSALGHQDTTITVDQKPTTPAELATLKSKIGNTPAGGAVVLVLALNAYAENPQKNLPFVSVALDGSRLVDHIDGFNGKLPEPVVVRNLSDRISGQKSYIVRSYVRGTAPEDGYTLPNGKWQIVIKEQSGDVKADTARMFVYSTGGVMPRPMRLRKDANGFWSAYEWSSLEVGLAKMPSNNR